MTLFSNITKDILNNICNELEKKKNKNKINKLIKNVMDVAMQHIRIYMYGIMALLIILFLMNFFQFYFYIKTKQHYFNPMEISKSIHNSNVV